MNDHIVKMQGIHKSFGANKVLKGVDLFIKKGSIHALLGENGTGKSTLMNILAGILPSDAGEIYIDNILKKNNQSSSSEKVDITFIHQELALVNDLSVMENMFLGSEIKKGIILNKEVMKQRTVDVLKKMNIEIDTDILVGDLNASFKQIIEIGKALLKDAKVIIMDEPTTSLTDVEIQSILKIMKSLKEQGVSIIFISHKLNEVIQVCDQYTVMRDGEVVATGNITSKITEAVIARHMVGKELSNEDIYKKRIIGESILELKDLSKDNEFRNINMYVKKGEIVGVTGLLGDGRSELFATVFGDNGKYEGDVIIDGKKVYMKSTTYANELGISYLPKNRKENGIIKDLSISENMILPILKKIRKFLFIDSKKVRQINDNYVDELNIKINDLNDSIISLSGGNQQKVILARALASNPKLVILDNPTQGVDVGAKLEIYNIIMELAEKGVSFVVLSNEAPEIIKVCDRVYIMFQGEIKRQLDRSQATEENIMVVATGGTLD